MVTRLLCAADADAVFNTAAARCLSRTSASEFGLQLDNREQSHGLASRRQRCTLVLELSAARGECYLAIGRSARHSARGCGWRWS